MSAGAARSLALVARATRLPFVAAGLLPFALGVSWVKGYPGAAVWLGALAVAAGHIAANLINELADHASGADAVDLTPRVFFGGSKLLQAGTLDRSWYTRAAFVALGVCIAMAGSIARSPRRSSSSVSS